MKSLMLSMEKHLSSASPVSETQAYEAQQLFYDAMQAGTLKEQDKLIHRALKLDPTNVDALLYCAREGKLGPELQIEVLRKIVSLGEKNLGPKIFKDMVGGFWGVLETRPYMRARHALAEALREEARFAEAIAESEAMLKLNPNDNQGVRYNLLACYLTINRLDGAERLFAKYKEFAFNAMFAWGRVLERLLVGDSAGAKKGLAVARKQNRYMEAYLTGRRKLPKDKDVPDSYAPGSKDEADCFAEPLFIAWNQHPKALDWLSEQKK